jgi:hypothetical protein
LPDTQRLPRGIGEYFVLLNNDVVVTDGRLDQLITLPNAKSGREENVTGENAENAESRSETEGGIETCGRFGCGVGRPRAQRGCGVAQRGCGVAQRGFQTPIFPSIRGLSWFAATPCGPK